MCRELEVGNLWKRDMAYILSSLDTIRAVVNIKTSDASQER